MHLSRRSLLALGVSVFLGACSGFDGEDQPTATTEYDPIPRPPLSDAVEYTGTTNPFTLGVAAGDPGPHRVVIWTRLAPVPGAPGGGLDGRSFILTWEVALDEEFSEVTFSGATVAEAGAAHSVHVDVAELEPAVSFWYRFRCGSHTSPVGRMATLPLHTLAETYTLADTSCPINQAQAAVLYRDIAGNPVDLLVFHGDYVDIGTDDNDLERIRALYTSARTSTEVQAAHASCAWLLGGLGPDGVSDAAARAWWEHMPVRLPPPEPGEPFPTYRNCSVGSLLDLIALQPRVDGSGRSLLGREQERWLLRGPGRTNAIWHAVSFRGDASIGERAEKLLLSRPIDNIVLLGATAADETAPLWWQHIVTPGRWTTASRFVDSSTGAITVSDEVTERIARSGDAS
ncbi:MAG: hypothetical protein F2934_01100 [Actinobacteria bacterium]|uniref:Unannotated protein n=1 Tax=freshwater metagenome TaxID=449393 RepID=A0A6J6Q507_9ZZZZ|nr:hypothetical protein [Actinomycetota bacterium]MSY12185.1 hypothetical protein [Actinomycetota bacterium]MSZ02829.1 hypothetical protein [Actinomycetota bacterium]MTB05708.1 hypothetical protein [Actinomycetota bacterium]